MQMRCPRCGNVVEAEPGQMAHCGQCGFADYVPGPSPAQPAWNQPAAPQPTPLPPPLAAPPERTPSSGPPAWTAEPVPPPQGLAPAAYASPPPIYPAGKPRNFWLSLILCIVTLGVYCWVWNFKTFRELDREHGEKHGAGFFWASLLTVIGAFVVAVAVILIFADIDKIEEDGQTRYEVAEGDAGGLAAQIIFWVGILAAFILFIVYLYREVARLQQYRIRRGLPEAVSPPLFVILSVLFFLLFVPIAIAYFMLTNSVNGVWRQVYDEKRVPWPL